MRSDRVCHRESASTSHLMVHLCLAENGVRSGTGSPRRSSVKSAFQRWTCMHELSIVSSVVDSVIELLTAYPGARVKEVRLRVGALAAVIEDSLQFCYGLATEDTPLEGSALVVKTVPIVGRCDTCAADVE